MRGSPLPGAGVGNGNCVPSDESESLTRFARGTCVWEGRWQAPVSGVPESTLRRQDSLEWPTGPRKAFTLVVIVYFSERVRVRLGEERRRTGQGPAENRRELPVGPSRGCGHGWRRVSPSSYVRHVGSSPVKEADPSLRVQGSSWGSVT